MAALRKEVKLFIVRSLAVFNTPEETARLVNEEYKDLNVSRQQCERYDPTKRAGQDLSQELRKEFEITRSEFLAKPNNIPIANLSVRLQRLENQYQKHSKNRVAALNILRQAAEDVGGKYTNKTEVTGKDGAPLQTTVVQATPEQVEAAVRKAQEEY
ncbi:DUF2280 domain-containing protein [Acinetobacter ursingii]|uniref:DUF2280 domain-containing protein n=1 Tax=Acinetobacter ursingii TaxID=108980 RepID=A0A3D2SSZ4_9GAMM|nr:DUF2280 domain-containing protein [Acinetobacter ursingii]MCH2004052.1 DUF2280 domain-containing protein [Acinetobacter ursingii]HCK31814.1 DUF2280 domain-containing protein [Acinetobacter ursingii]